MKPEMIKFEACGIEFAMPASTAARLALASLGSQVVPPSMIPANAPVIAPTEIPALGAYWPDQGGVNAGLVRAGNTGRDYYLVVAHGDEGEFEDVTFGPRDFEAPGADSAWNGLANTRALIESGKTHPAAEACASFTCDGHTDFYLPARRELQIAEANVPEVFSKNWHWSSSQRSANVAFIMHFSDGTQLINAKSNELRARPVRRLFI